MPRHLSFRTLKLKWLWALVALLLVVALASGGIWVARALSDETPAASAPDAAPATAAPPVPSASPTANAPPTKSAIAPDFSLPPIEDGMVPVLTKIPTAQKVVFLTIDDGGAKLPEDVALLRANKIKASLFLAKMFIANDPDYFKQFLTDGSKIENHTMSHQLNFIKLGYQEQKNEICKMADFEEQTYGRRPVFFRPPGGPYTNAIRKAAAECGMKAIVTWEAKANAGRVDYQVGQVLRPGDIVLMHFRPEFAQDFQAFLDAKNAAGLEVVLLEDFLKVP